MMHILKRIGYDNLPFMFDAGFYSFHLHYALHRQRRHFLMKISSSLHLSPIKGGCLPDGSYLALIKGKIEDPPPIPPPNANVTGKYASSFL